MTSLDNTAYQVVLSGVHKGIKEFERKVSRFVCAGYRPTGTFVIINGYYAQAVYKEI